MMQVSKHSRRIQLYDGNVFDRLSLSLFVTLRSIDSVEIDVKSSNIVKAEPNILHI